MTRRPILILALTALFAGGVGVSSAIADHEATTELHTVTNSSTEFHTVTIGGRRRTVTDVDTFSTVLTDTDPVPHPTTTTTTATTTTTSTTSPTTTSTTPATQPDVILTNQNWTCTGFQNRNLVRLTITENEFNNDVMNLRADCHGRIGRLEILAYSGHDMIDVNNASPAPHDFTIESGFVRVRGTTTGAHQDGIQLTNDTPARNILFKNLVFSGLDTQHFISSSSAVQGVVCDGCTFLPEHAGLIPAHTELNGGPANAMILEGFSGNPDFNHSGTLNSLVCIGTRYNNGVRALGGAIGWSGHDTPAPGSGNVLLPASDPLCQQPG